MKYFMICIVVMLQLASQATAQYTQTTAVISSGGGSASSDKYNLLAVIGQVTPPGVATAGNFILSGGFIYTIAQQEIIVDSVIVGPANSGSDVQVTAKVSPSNQVEQVKLFYRTGGSADFAFVAMTAANNERYSGKIPSAFATSRGIDFYILAMAKSGSSTRWPDGGIQAISVKVAEPGAVNTVAQPSGEGLNMYRIVSFPLDLTDKSPRAVLEDDLGPYDDKKWRFYELREDQKYYEYAQISDIKPGEAFWLIVKESGKILDTGAGVTLPTNKKFNIALWPGWNFVGNPFDFPIPRANFSLKSGNVVDARHFEGDWRQAEDELKPFTGWAVANNTNVTDTLRINPYLTPALQKSDPEAESKPLWAVHIKAECGSVRDLDNVAAVAESALSDCDPFDRPEPPVIGDYISVSFPHHDWDRPLKSYAIDVRPEPRDGDIWEFEAMANLSESIKLTFNGVDAVPAEMNIYLCDPTNKMLLDLRQRQVYEFTPFDGTARRFQLIIGNASYALEKTASYQALPTDYLLLQNYPNPFNPSTTICFELPQGENVHLRIVNALGQEIVELSRGERFEAGRHTLVWDARTAFGEKVGSGVYFYEISAGSWKDRKKMVLMQ